LIAVIKRLFGLGAPRSKPDFVPATWADYGKAMGDAFIADAHEDRLFYAYQDLCRKQGKEFDFEGFFRYAGEHWRLDYDPYGYRKSFLEGTRHPSALTLDRLKAEAKA